MPPVKNFSLLNFDVEERIFFFPRHSLLSLWLAATVYALVPLSAAKAQTMKENFAWLDSLELPDGDELEFRKYESIDFRVGIGDQNFHAPYYGFYLREDEQFIWLHTLNLVPVRLEKSEITEVSGFSFTNYIEQYLDATGMHVHLRRSSFGLYDDLPEVSYAAIVGWLASKRGTPELASQLYNYAQTYQSKYDKSDIDLSTNPPLFRERIKSEIGNTLLRQAISRLEAWPPYELSRVELLKRFEHIARHFPDPSDATFLKRTAVVLKQMIDEDIRHKSLAAGSGTLKELIRSERDYQKTMELAIGNLPIEEQVESWLYYLRDVRGELTATGHRVISVHAVSKLGKNAVPYLVRALDDERVTRAVHQNNSFGLLETGPGQSARIVRVGDVAARAVYEITGWAPMEDTPRLWDSRPEAIVKRREAKERAIAEWAEREGKTDQD